MSMEHFVDFFQIYNKTDQLPHKAAEKCQDKEATREKDAVDKECASKQ